MSAVFTPTRYKLSIEDYHKLGEAGILDEDSRVELIEGDLIEMAPIGVSHMRCVNRLNRLHCECRRRFRRGIGAESGNASTKIGAAAGFRIAETFG